MGRLWDDGAAVSCAPTAERTNLGRRGRKLFVDRRLFARRHVTPSVWSHSAAIAATSALPSSPASAALSVRNCSVVKPLRYLLEGFDDIGAPSLEHIRGGQRRHTLRRLKMHVIDQLDVVAERRIGGEEQRHVDTPRIEGLMCDSDRPRRA